MLQFLFNFQTTDRLFYLIGQSMERSSQSVHGSGKGKVGIREGTTHKMAGMGTHIATLVVTETTHINQV